MGVSHHAVSLPPFLFCSTAEDQKLVSDVVGRGNDELASYTAGAPDRLLALGSVPLGWPGAADEARRCLDDLGMAGLAIGSSGGRRDLDDPVNEDFWSLCHERGVFVFLHPSGVPDGHRQRDFYLAQLVGYPMETALAVARLLFGGVLERVPSRPSASPTGAGACRRCGAGWTWAGSARTSPAPRPCTRASSLTGCYYDTAVFSTVLLRRLVEDVGAGHVLLGTDHPFELGDRYPARRRAGPRAGRSRYLGGAA